MLYVQAFKMPAKTTWAFVSVMALLAMHHLCVAEAYSSDVESYGDRKHGKNDHYYHHEGHEHYPDHEEHEHYPDHEEHEQYGYAPTIPAPSITDISPNGQSMSELSQIFWQWILRFNKDSSPISASNPLDCNYGVVGGGDVLVIGGVIGAEGDTFNATRECHLKNNIKAIFIPLLNIEADTETTGDVETLNQPGGWLSNTSPTAIIRDLTTSVFLKAKSDGHKVHIPGWPKSKEHQTQFIKDNFYVVTPMFSLAGPSYQYSQYTGPSLAATTGYYVLLDVENVKFPLELNFGGQFVFPGGSFTLDITYNIYAP